MDRPRTRARTSKSEAAFRFIAGTAIASALYYTPDIRWSAEAPSLHAARIDVTRSPSVEPASASCAPSEHGDLLVDASMEGR